MEERNYYVWDQKTQSNYFNHDTLFNLHCCACEFEEMHNRDGNVPNGFFHAIVEKLTEDEIILHFAYATDGRFEKVGHEISGPPVMHKEGPITLDIARDFFDKIGVQYWRDGEKASTNTRPFDVEAEKKTMYYMPTKFLKEEHKHLSKYYGEEESNN